MNNEDCSQYPYENPDYAGLPDMAAAWWRCYSKPKGRRGACTCPVPAVSARPAGRMRHGFCTQCHGSWNFQAQIDAGNIIYGWQGKHRKKPLWKPALFRD